MGDNSRPAPAGRGSQTGLTWGRCVKFSAVGLVGIGVQLAALWALAGLGGWHYLVATIVATETAVLHNFLWHIRWTWADRPASAGETLARLVRFHVTNGLVSIVGNTVLMMVLTGFLGIHYLLANMLGILVCALANLALSEFWVFRREWSRCDLIDIRCVEEAGSARHC